MATQPLDARVRFQPGMAIIDLKGEIDSFGEAALQAAYDEADRQQPEAILLNFSEVGYINSTGIALIVGLLAQARKARRRMLIWGLSDHYQHLFTITRLADFMTIVPDEAAALAAASV